jgi:hypothetical protein
MMGYSQYARDIFPTGEKLYEQAVKELQKRKFTIADIKAAVSASQVEKLGGWATWTTLTSLVSVIEKKVIRINPTSGCGLEELVSVSSSRNEIRRALALSSYQGKLEDNVNALFAYLLQTSYIKSAVFFQGSREGGYKADLVFLESLGFELVISFPNKIHGGRLCDIILLKT